MEYSSIKNIYNEKIEEYERTTGSSSAHNGVDLGEIMIHLESNPILKNIAEAKNRFWDCAIVDVIINNNDRNNGNWGVIMGDHQYRLAPVFDNGAAFPNKLSGAQMNELLNDEKAFLQHVNSARTAYGYNGKDVWSKQLLTLDIPGLKDRAKKICSLYNERKDEIIRLIRDIPEEYHQNRVCSSIQKDFMIKSMDARVKYLIEPALEMKQEGNGYDRR